MGSKILKTSSCARSLQCVEFSLKPPHFSANTSAGPPSSITSAGGLRSTSPRFPGFIQFLELLLYRGCCYICYVLISSRLQHFLHEIMGSDNPFIREFRTMGHKLLPIPGCSDVFRRDQFRNGVNTSCNRRVL